MAAPGPAPAAGGGVPGAARSLTQPWHGPVEVGQHVGGVGGGGREVEGHLVAERPLTAQTRVRIPAGSLAQGAGVAREISAIPASVVAGGGSRTTGGPKLSGVVRLLTVREVAERLAVCTPTVYSLVERGE